MPLPCVFARCVGPFSLVGVVASFFWCTFSQISTHLQCVPLGVHFFRSEANVSVLSSIVQGMAQQCSCRVKFSVQFFVVRTIFLRFLQHCCEARLHSFSSRGKFNVRPHPLLDGIVRFSDLSTAE